VKRLKVGFEEQNSGLSAHAYIAGVNIYVFANTIDFGLVKCRLTVYNTQRGGPLQGRGNA